MLQTGNARMKISYLSSGIDETVAMYIWTSVPWNSTALDANRY